MESHESTLFTEQTLRDVFHVAPLGPSEIDARWQSVEARHAAARGHERSHERVAGIRTDRPGRGRRVSYLLPRTWRTAIIGSVACGLAVVAGFWILEAGQSRGRADQPQSYTTVAGQRMTVRLADGSRVTLAPQSQLSVTHVNGSARGDSERVVSLQGEAYFEVAPNTRAPFLVRTGLETTQVLGTSFGVRYDDTDRIVRVAVVTGKVAVRGRHAPMTLTAGAVGRVTDSAATVEMSRDVRAYTDWVNGRLVFNDVPIATMLATIGHWYGYEFRLADAALGTQSISTVLNVDDPEKTMAAIKTLLRVTMTFNGRVVTLHQHHNRSTAPSATRRQSDAQLSTPREVGK